MRYILNFLWENSTDHFFLKEFLKCLIKICFGFVFFRRCPNLVVPLLRIFKYGLENVVVMVRSQEHDGKCGRYPRNQSDSSLEPLIATTYTLLHHIFTRTVVIVFTYDA